MGIVIRTFAMISDGAAFELAPEILDGKCIDPSCSLKKITSKGVADDGK
jgi:hypothetical protein